MHLGAREQVARGGDVVVRSFSAAKLTGGPPGPPGSHGPVFARTPRRKPTDHRPFGRHEAYHFAGMLPGRIHGCLSMLCMAGPATLLTACPVGPASGLETVATESMTGGLATIEPVGTSATDEATSVDPTTVDPATVDPATDGPTTDDTATDDPTTAGLPPPGGSCERRVVDDGQVSWGVACGTSSTDLYAGSVRGASGELLGLAEISDDAFDLGSGLLAPFGGADIVVMRLDTAGGLVWGQRWGSSGDDDAGSLVPTPDGGQVTVVSAGGSSFQIGAAQLELPDGGSDLIIKTNAAGELEWHRPLSDQFRYWYTKTAIGPAGEIGVYYSVVTNNEWDSVLSVFEPSGALKFTRVLAGIGPQNPGALVFTADGVVVVGSVDFELDLDGPGLPEFQGEAMFIARFSAAGELSWTARFPVDYALLNTEALALAPNGDILLGGSFGAAIDLGGGLFEAVWPNEDCNADPCEIDEEGPCDENCNNRDDIFVARLDPDGEHLWSRQLGTDSASDSIAALGVTADDRTVVIWSAWHDADPQPTRIDTFDAAGQSLTSVETAVRGAFGGSVDPSGVALVGGSTAESVDFGSGPVENRGFFDFWFAKFTP